MEESAHANIIHHSLVEVRRNVWHVSCSINVHWPDRFTDSISERFNLEWKSRTLRVLAASGLMLRAYFFA
jgi:hypothetical protein